MKSVFRVPLIFAGIFCLAFAFSGMSLSFVTNEVITHFVRDGVMVMALIIPIWAGMGVNFSIVVGALCAQVGLILVLDFGLAGLPGLFSMATIGFALSLVMGISIGICLNRVKNREMIIIGFVATAVYQLIFMVGYGTVIRPTNQQMMLSRGIGIRNMLDLEMFRELLDRLWLVKLGSVEIPVFMVIAVTGFGLIIKYLDLTRLGKAFSVVGQSFEKAQVLGLDADIIRIKALVLSTLIACLGHLFYILNIGMLNVYTAHMNTDIFSCAALFAGGATPGPGQSPPRHPMHCPFSLAVYRLPSPQAGQNMFENPALGEYFRSFVAYGTIAFALILNTGATKKPV